jgi:hypothetical protein
MSGETDLSMRRQEQRLAVALPIELHNGYGVTRNVSASGVFFETSLPFSQGAAISFCLLLDHADPVGPIRLHCQGKILRVEHLPGKSGVAVSIDQHRFEAIEVS